MNLEEKGCLDRDENDLISNMSQFLAPSAEYYYGHLYREAKLIPHFSTPGCYYECMIQFTAYSCSCLPWTFPQFNLTMQTNYHIDLTSLFPCDMRGNQCFLKHFYNFEKVSCPVCDRLPSCDRIFYRRSVTVRKVSFGREWCGNILARFSGIKKIVTFQTLSKIYSVPKKVLKAQI